MNFVMKAILSCALLCVRLTQTSEIIIRAAHKKDCSMLTAMCKKVIKEDFRKIVINGYPDSPIAQDQAELDEFLHNWSHFFENLFDEKTSSLNEDNRQLLIAVDQHAPENILGLCFSQRQNDQAYIRFIGVDENCRNKGVGRALLAQTISSYPGVTSCALKTFSHANEDAQRFYEKQGFSSDKKAAPLLNKLTEHSDTITFLLYKLDIH
jgi:ribosomal protein S18 acetylase RimI-like enzyme